MGCGQSKDDPQTVLVSSKFIPFLRWRLQEIKGRNNNNNSNNNTGSDYVTLSKKELLEHSNHEDENDSSSIDRKSEASCEENVRPSSASYLKDEDKLEQNWENKATDCNQLGQERLLDDKAEDDEEEGRLSNVDSCYLCPGSPSFRIYCVDQPVENANDETDDRDIDKDDEYDQKSQGHDSGETAPSTDSTELPQESVTSESVIPTKGKGKKGGRFMKVICNGKSAGAVNNLLNVTSCYHQLKYRRHNSQILPQQAS